MKKNKNKMSKFGYSVVEVLGTGSFGTVLKCLDKNGSECCIKQIKINESAQAGWHQQIMQEIYLLKNLQHPRIIKFLGHFSTTKCVCIVMEYARRGPLSEYLMQQQKRKIWLDQYDLISFLIDILQGMEFLHIKNVVHKDIKPANILISAEGRLQLADFGVSKIMNVENGDFKNLLMSNGGKTKEASGTPSYMAPETLKNKYFSFASDMWALGCILYELCTFKPPFSFVKSLDELIYYTENAIYIPINVCGRIKYTPELISLCSSMITPEPKRRATIRDIITNDLIIRRYYRSYFDYGYDFKCSGKVNSTAKIDNNKK